MPDRCLPIARLAALAVGIFVCGPAAAQAAPHELRVRMGQFVQALSDSDGGTGGIIRFFPRHSPLTIERVPDPSGAMGPVLRRVLHPDSARTHLENSDLGCAFGGALGMVTDEWHYMGAGRFAPRSRGDRGRLSLEWVRERGVWVVRRITEAYYIPRRVLGTAVGEMSRDTGAYSWLPEERRYAVATEWYRTHQPIAVAGRRLVKYGLPRRLTRDLLQTAGAIGVVPVFMEKGNTYPPEVVYVLVGPDEYQPYQDTADTVEDICGRWW
jgi:hypothetical protein